MSKMSRKFKVPDELANLYDFANSLDLRHFTHHGVTHQQADEITDAEALAAWMAERGLLAPRAKITQATFDVAIAFRSRLRDYLACEPDRRRTDKAIQQALNASASSLPLLVEFAAGRSTLRPAGEDGLSGLATLMAELHDGSANGTLDRLKMCAAEECRRVFFDRSKPGSRRWCVSTLCGNRIKTRAYRERHQASA